MDPRERERDATGPQLAGDLHEDVRAVRVGEEHRLGVDDDAGRRVVAERELVDARAEVVGVGEEQRTVDPQDEDRRGSVTRPGWSSRSWKTPETGSRPNGRTEVREERAISSSSESATPMRMPAMIPKARMPSIAAAKNTKSARLVLK